MFFLLLAGILWGTSFVVGKTALQSVDPFMLAELRLFVSALIMAPFMRGAFARFPKDMMGHACAIALLNAACFGMQMWGLSLTSASSAVAMLGVEPLSVIIAGYLFFGSSITRANVALCVLAGAGVWVIVGAPAGSGVNVWGCAVILASTFATAVWVHISKKILFRVNSVTFTIVSSALSVVTGLPMALLFASDLSLPSSIAVWGQIAYLSTFCSLLALALWNKGLARSNPNYGGVFFAVEPALGVVLSVAFLGDPLTVPIAVGLSMVLLATALTFVLPSAKADPKPRAKKTQGAA